MTAEQLRRLRRHWVDQSINPVWAEAEINSNG